MEQAPEFDAILPEFVDVYSWEILPTGPYIVLTIKTPEGFDATKVTASLNAEKTAVSCRYPNQPPIVEGLLFEPVKGMEMKINKEEKNITLTFSTEGNKTPEFVVVDIHPETKRMDPLSSFFAFHTKSHSPDENQQKGCFRYLEFGLEANFVPAMLAAASIFQRIPQLADQSFGIVKLAADKYKSAPACLQMGLFLINSPEKDLALEYMEKAASDDSLPFAKAILGVMLSPISDMECHKKDAKRAAELFEKVLTFERNPLALHELAMLLFNGIGVEKDVERAQKLNDECKALEEGQTPELEERDENYVPRPPECHCGHCHCHDEDEHECGCGHCHCHEEHECGCGHCHEEHEEHVEHECGCGHCHGGHCDGHGGCGCGGKCDGHGGCGCHDCQCGKH